MDRHQFWMLIEQSRQEAIAQNREATTDLIDVHMATLTDALRRLSPRELISFQQHFSDCLELAYRWDVWAAAYWLYGGCSDDGFWDFRSCLISTGQQNFERVLADPDDLAELDGRDDIPYLQAEGFQYLAGKAYQGLTGSRFPDDAITVQGREPSGERFDFDNRELIASRFPKLVEKYPEMGD